MTAPLWTRAEAQAATGGHARGGDWVAGGVSIDSRTLEPGDLFVALAGPNHDGHDFATAALARGASACLVERVAAGFSADAPLLIVEDTMLALRRLAEAARRRSQARIVAVTGSVGKTGTKEMLSRALAAAGPTHASAGNLNNEIGVPLSLARLPAAARYAVFEVGMNHPGEITPLSRLIRPDVVVVTTVEAAHLEFFASTAEIAAAKAEIFAGVPSDGAAVLPRDNRHYGLLRDAARDAGIRQIVSFGAHIEADARLLHASAGDGTTQVAALIGEVALNYRLDVAGRHWATNSLAVLLAARAVGVAPAAAAAALAGMSAPKGRGARATLPWGDGILIVIDEAYNANPASMRAAIAALAASRPGTGGRRIAALGDMLELGEAAPRLHAALAPAIVEAEIDLVITAGPLMKNLYDALPVERRGAHAADSVEAATLVKGLVAAGDVVMVKGSAGSRMGRIVTALEEAAAPLRPAANGG